MKTPRDSQIEHLLDRQARLWESERVAYPRVEPAVRPNVTLSQRPFSGAEELAQRLAKGLGWEVYDRQIVEALHEDDALGKSVLESLDERLLGFREDWVYHLFVPGHTSTTAYVHRLSQLIFSIAMRGHNVFLGRGATFVVPREWRLSVLLTRSLEARATRCSQHSGLARDAARHELARLDRIRAEFVSRSFHRIVDDPASHDLCINLDAFGLDEATEIVQRALVAHFPGVPLQHRA
jgi:hypothetical protein